MKKNKLIRGFRSFLVAFILSVFGFASFAGAQAKRPKTPVTGQKVIQPNDSAKYISDPNLLRQMQSLVKIVESKQAWTRFDRQLPIVNKARSRSAYIAEFAGAADGDGAVEVIVVHEKSSGRFYEVRGFELFSRPFDRLMWRNDDELQFDQWITPHNGGRYVVNLRTGKVVLARYISER